MRAFDGQHHLVQMPFVAAPELALAQGVGIRLPELQSESPLPDGFVGDENAPVSHHLFDVPKAQCKSKIQPHGMADDGGGIAESLVYSGIGHPRILRNLATLVKLTMPWNR